MDRYARLVGYSVALALLAGMLWLVSSLREGILFPHNRIKVRFPAIGTLMEDDPVKLQGVQVGRVEAIRSEDGSSVATLELFHRTPLAKGTRFINYNYSLFGARMIVLVPGDSREPIDASAVQEGDFSTGVTETIHRVEDLLRTVVEYRKLSARLEHGDDTSQSLQQLLTTKLYPALEEFGAMTRDMDALEKEASTNLDRLAAASVQVDRFGKELSAHSDTLMVRANRSLTQLATLTAQATVVLRGLETLALAAQDTTQGPSRVLMQRDLYDHALALTHALQDLLKIARKDGITDAIHFWRNVHFRFGKPKNQ